MWSQELPRQKHTLKIEKYKPMKTEIVKGDRRSNVCFIIDLYLIFLSQKCILYKLRRSYDNVKRDGYGRI